MLPIDVHPSASTDAVRREVAEGLRENRLETKGLYLTARQAELWRQVSLRHSPVHTRPEFRRIYEEAFAKVADQMRDAPNLELVALGSGTGAKEAQLLRHLQPCGRAIHFSVIDVAQTLVEDSVQSLIHAGGVHRRSAVCDLQQIDFLSAWLDTQTGTAPRLITFFGLVPNFTPSRLTPLLRAFLRPRDFLLASVHLVPSRSKEPAEVLSAMRSILPQYDNPETLAWLAAGLETWQLA